MSAILKIGKSIHALNPRLDESKYMEYAVSIFKASKKYEIEPGILMAIAQQETGYRENLPEGAAGERGICQIRRMWLKNPKFIKEFKVQTIEDLEKPVKNFLFAAWILKDLKRTVAKGSLPFWSYYNSVRFENRFKYFLAVNRNIATLLRYEIAQNEISGTETLVAAVEPKVELLPPKREMPRPNRAVAAQPKIVPIASSRRDSVSINKASFSNDVQDLMQEGSHWIPDALNRMQREKNDRKNKSQDKQAFQHSFTRELAANLKNAPTQD